jgi:hypothetical protein
VPTAYGVAGTAVAANGLIRIGLEYTATASEQMDCEVQTRTYDIGQPSLFKRLFGWELLMVATYWVEASINPIDVINEPQLTWAELEEYTWQEANNLEIEWLPAGAGVPVIVGGLPASNPNPQVVKVSGKQTFKRAFFKVRFQNDGTSSTAPARLDGIVLYLTNGRRIAMSRTA